MAGYLAGDVDEWIYIDIDDQHPDSIRFVKDCESAIGTKNPYLTGKRLSLCEGLCSCFWWIPVQIMDLRPVQIG